MVPRFSSHIAATASCIAFACCSAQTSDEPAVTKDALKLSFNPMYSAFDGVRDYQLPVTLEAAAYDPLGTDPVDVSTVRWKVDEKFVKQTEYPELPAGVLLTTKRAGTTVVTAEGTAKSGRRLQGTATLHITQADPAEWELGEARYNNMVPVQMMLTPEEEQALAEMGGYPFDKDASCANCHNSMGGGVNAFVISIEHTPQQTAGYTDEDLINIFTKGMKPMEGKFHSPFFEGIPMYFAEMEYKRFHTWNIAPEVERGIVYKLRSITPRTQETLDYERIMRESEEALAAAMAEANGGDPGPDSMGAAGSGM